MKQGTTTMRRNLPTSSYLKTILTPLLLILLMTACQQQTLQEAAQGQYGQIKITANDRHAVYQTVTPLTFNLLRAMHREGENLLISPQGLVYALSILHIGAEGQTRLELDSLLHHTDNDNAKMYALFHKMMVSDAATQSDKEQKNDGRLSVLANENTIVHDPLLPLTDEFAKRSEAELFATISSSPTVRGITITNRLVFDGYWDEEFDPGLTEYRPFRQEHGQVDSILMMEKQFHAQYMQTDDFQLLRVPYTGHFSMYILLPRQDTTIKDMLGRLDAKLWNTLCRRMREEDVHLWLPKFKMRRKIKLDQPLQTIGLRTAFESSRANLSSLSDYPTYVEHVTQDVLLDVTEEHTHAEATTTIEVVALSAVAPSPEKHRPVYEVRCDHPFLFFIVNDFGSICFAGEYMVP